MKVKFTTQVQDKEKKIKPYKYTGTGETVSFSDSGRVAVVVDDASGLFYQCPIENLERIKADILHFRLAEKSDSNYRPLPDCLTIKNSAIEGLGLFATKNIQEDISLGVSHYLINKEIVRTPLGGFYNHSDEPNCTKVKVSDQWYELTTLRDIKAGEEITVSYTLYSIA